MATQTTLTDLGRAVAAAVPGTQSRGGPGLRLRRHVPAFPADHPIVQAVGVPVHVRDASVLVGLSGGMQKFLGSCVVNGRVATFDFWFPHLGIAVDVGPAKRDELMATGLKPFGRRAAGYRKQRRTPSPEEVQLKQEWCRTRGIVYAAPDDNDLDALRAIAEKRRMGRMDDVRAESAN